MRLSLARKRRRRKRRPYKVNKRARARRKHRRRRHKRSKVSGNKERRLKETRFTNMLLKALLKATVDDVHYDPRHHTKDPEYKHSDDRTKEFKKGFNAPDTHFWRPQGESYKPYRTNFAEDEKVQN